MATPATATPAKASNGSTPTKRGDGDFVISFIDDKGAPSKRVSPETALVRVTDKGGKHIDLDPSKFSDQVFNQLVVMALAKRVDVYTRNTKKLSGGDVIELAKSVYDGLLNNVIYSRKEGGKGSTGRPFDYDFANLVFANAYKTRYQKDIPEKLVAQFNNKLRTQTPKERKEYIARLKEDKVISTEWKKADVARQIKAMKNDKGSVNAFEGF